VVESEFAMKSADDSRSQPPHHRSETRNRKSENLWSRPTQNARRVTASQVTRLPAVVKTSVRPQHDDDGTDVNDRRPSPATYPATYDPKPGGLFKMNFCADTYDRRRG